jgi:hypothetical protein
VVPGFGDSPEVEGYDIASLYERYKAGEGIGSNAPPGKKEIYKEYIEKYGDLEE